MTNGLFLVLSYPLHLICFRVVLASFTLTTMAVRNTSEGFAFVLSLGRFERIKRVLMGTNRPHTCIPGLVWQKQARRFSQFEFKVGELRFPIHFVCVSAALYHRGVRGRHFPLRWIWPIPSVDFYGLRAFWSTYVGVGSNPTSDTDLLKYFLSLFLSSNCYFSLMDWGKFFSHFYQVSSLHHFGSPYPFSFFPGLCSFKF